MNIDGFKDRRSHGYLAIDDLIFTHNPDNLTAWRPIFTSGKKLFLRDGNIYASVKGKLYPFDVDVDMHHFSCDLVGYKSEDGAYKVIEKDDLLGIVEDGSPGKGLMKVDLFQDIGGEYFPILTDPDKRYCIRFDGQVEEITFYKSSCNGRVVENLRGRIKKM